MKLSIDSGKSNGLFTNGIILASFIFVITSNLTGISNVFSSIRIVSMLLLVVFGYFYIISCGQVYWRTYLLWGIIFIFILLVSLFYAPQFDLAWTGIYSYISIFIPVFMMLQVINNLKDVDRLMNTVVFSGVLLSIISILFYREDLYSESRFSAIGNPNSIMVMLLLPIYILIYRIIAIKKYRIANIIFLLLCSSVILFTGSRKGIFIPLTFTLVFTILNNKRKLPKRFGIILGCILLISFLIFNVPELSNVIGKRVELFYNTLFDSDNVDYFSDLARINFREYAFALFLESPFIGHGINMFASIYGTYSHNNYTEILASLGIIGFISFYWIHVYSLWNLFKVRRFNKKYRDYYDFAISILIANLAYDWGAVSYDLLHTMLSIAISICIILLTKQKLHKEYNK